MALTLRAAITATQTTFDVTGSDALTPGDFKTIGSETIEIRTANQATVNSGETAHYRVSAYRGALGSVEAVHAAGDALTTTVLGGGDSGLPDPAEAPDGQVPTTAAGAYELGPRVVESETDPGAIGAGNLWVRLDPEQMHAPVLYVRNAADDGWSDDENAGYLLGLTYYDGLDVVSSIYGDSGAGGGLYLEQVDGASLTLSGGTVLEAGPAADAILRNERNVIALQPGATDNGSLRISHKDALDVETAVVTLNDTGIDVVGELRVTAFNVDGFEFGRAAFVANGSTVDQLRDALIAAGLMAAS